MNSVALSEVSKHYGAFVAVNRLSFACRPGEIYGLLGPNGAGKTSTLRMMIGITAPDSGEVRLFDEPFRREHLQRLGYLPEERGLYRRMSILEHLVFLAELRGISRRDAKARTLAWSSRLQLADWIHAKVDALSKGMQQKVQFLGAILHNPDLLILDEPFSGLDPSNAIVLKDVLLELKQAGKTILFSTHRMDQVEKLCDGICLMDHGRAVLEGPLDRIKKSYGKNHVHLQYEGTSAFLQDRELVQTFNDYGKYVEVQLQPGADAQQLLLRAASQARITKFELQEPSLEEIFLDAVGGSRA
jgi:ABC-2 type transport system ATP-binding protein